MKALPLLSLVLSLPLVGQASTVLVTPELGSVEQFEAGEAVSWGFDLALPKIAPKGWAVTGIKLTVGGITQIDQGPNQIFFNLLDNPTNGLKFYQDNTPGLSDYFQDGGYALKPGQELTALGSWSDTNGPAITDTLSYFFTSAQVNAFNRYLRSASGFDLIQVNQGGQPVTIPIPQATVGLTFDLDGNYAAKDVSLTLVTSRVPDAGNALALLALSLLPLLAFRRR